MWRVWTGPLAKSERNLQDRTEARPLPPPGIQMARELPCGVGTSHPAPASGQFPLQKEQRSNPKLLLTLADSSEMSQSVREPSKGLSIPSFPGHLPARRFILSGHFVTRETSGR